METQPAHILVLIYDWGCILDYNWYIGDTYLSLDDPGALAQEWSNFMCNKIYEVQNELDRGFHLYGYINRIVVYGLRPSARRLIGKRRIASVGQPKDSLANHSFALVSPFVVSRWTSVVWVVPQ